MEPSIIPLFELLKLNSRLFNNALDEISDETAFSRVNEHINPIVYIAAHLLDARYYLVKMLHVDAECIYKQIFEQADTFEQLKDCPPLAGIINNWNEISEKLEKHMDHLEAGFMAKNLRHQLPVSDKSRSGAFTFFMQHEAYHIGQLGLIRKMLGLKAMKY